MSAPLDPKLSSRVQPYSAKTLDRWCRQPTVASPAAWAHRPVPSSGVSSTETRTPLPAGRAHIEAHALGRLLPRRERLQQVQGRSPAALGLERQRGHERNGAPVERLLSILPARDRAGGDVEQLGEPYRGEPGRLAQPSGSPAARPCRSAPARSSGRGRKRACRDPKSAPLRSRRNGSPARQRQTPCRRSPVWPDECARGGGRVY